MSTKVHDINEQVITEAVQNVKLDPMKVFLPTEFFVPTTNLLDPPGLAAGKHGTSVII